MLPPRREIVCGLATFALVVLIGAMPAGAVRTSFSRALSAVCHIVFVEARFGGGARVEMRALASNEPARAGQNVEEDTRLLLHAPGRAASASLGLNLRRDAYLPLLIFFATVLALPIARREKAACLAVGIPSVMAVAVASIWLLVAQITSQLPGGIAIGWRQDILEFMFERWLTPPGNRVIAPLFFAAALASLFQRFFKQRPPAGVDVGAPGEHCRAITAS